MNLKQQEKRLDAEFEQLGVTPQVVHMMAVRPFRAVTFAFNPSQPNEKVVTTYMLKMMLDTIRNREIMHWWARYVLQEIDYFTCSGIAICDPRDKFDDLKGSVIAKGRLLKRLRQQEQADFVPEEEYALHDRGMYRCAFVKLTPEEIAKLKTGEQKSRMIIKPEHFENGGEIECCNRDGRISIRFTKEFIPAGTKALDSEIIGGRFIATVNTTFTPIYEVCILRYMPPFFSRFRKVEVLKRGSLQEVVAFTNELCGLEDTVEE